MSDYLGVCPFCKGPIGIRNPTGTCDHLYYPDNVIRSHVELDADEILRITREYFSDDPICYDEFVEALKQNQDRIIKVKK